MIFYRDLKKYLQIAESWKNRMYTEQEARELVIKAGKMLVENGLVARTWGNVSAKISESEFIITPSGKAYEDLGLDDLVKVKIEDASYEGDIKPSSEKGAHAAVYFTRPTANFVIHTHQFFASAIAADEKDTAFAPCSKYGLPGTDRLKKNIEKTLKEHVDAKKIFMAKHGTLIIGDSFEEAFELAQELENECKELFKSRIPSMDPYRTGTIDEEKLKTKDNPFVIVTQNEYVNECCHAGITVPAYIDDCAQIVGPSVAVVENRKLDMLAGLLGRNAVLVKGIGAVCVGPTQSDAEAVAMIVSKNCAAACYVRKSGPMGKIDAFLQRYIYKKKYSKLKDEK